MDREREMERERGVERVGWREASGDNLKAPPFPGVTWRAESHLTDR